MSIQQLNNQLMSGILPDDLNFGIKRDSELDLVKLKYNAFYRSYDFYESKFPKGINSIIGFDKVIDNIIYKAKDKTPLDEIEKLKNNNIQ